MAEDQPIDDAELADYDEGNIEVAEDQTDLQAKYVATCKYFHLPRAPAKSRPILPIFDSDKNHSDILGFSPVYPFMKISLLMFKA